MGTPIIKLNKISFKYSREPVLEDINVSIFKGDYIGLIGPNGGGKTTLLKIILGLLRPDTGNVELFDKGIESFKDWTKFGYLPQRLVQADTRFPVTVQEVVSQGRIAKAGLFKRFSQADFKAVGEAMKLCEVDHLKNRVIPDLSGGQRQRVFIARALAGEPEVLILDEPSTGIDAASQGRFYRFLKELNAGQDITILFVSHDIDVLSHEASRFICVNQKLVFDGSADVAFQKNENLLENLYGDNVRHLFHSY